MTEPPRSGRSRIVWTTDPDGSRHRWHVLDTDARTDPDELRATGGDADRPTLLCLHGNPTWSTLWRRVLDAAPPDWRVVAPDQLGMGWSDRLEQPRRLAERIEDIDRLMDALGVVGPVAVAVHDWGGPVGLGWAVRLAERGEISRLRGLVITNTAVHQPDRPPPGLIRLARSRALRTLVTQRTPVFVRGAAALSRPRLPADVRRELAGPYRTAERRGSVADFVADIPLEVGHPSRPTLDAVAEGLRGLRSVPALVVWGARDPVFTAAHLDDLLERVPQADVQRYPHASHLVTEDVPEIAELVWRWLERAPAPVAPESPGPGLPRVQAGPAPDVPAVVELDVTGRAEVTTFGDLRGRIDRATTALIGQGVRAGQRVAVLVPPGTDLTALVYGCWQIGAAIVVTDANLGLRSLAAALRSAAPDHVVGPPAALRIARLLRIPGSRLALDALTSLRGVPLRRADDDPVANPDAAVLFTSGATGVPKGVVYSATRLQAQLAAVAGLIGVRADDRLVAAFAPFSLYGPALGLTAVIPAMDLTRPATLTADALAAAVAAADATVVFASPAALASVIATATKLDDHQRRALAGVRLLLSAGAPVGLALLDAVAKLLPNAELHTPYGMTEMLPVTDVSHADLRNTGPGNGTLVGHALRDVEIRIAPLGSDGVPDEELTSAPEVTGEIVVTGPHLKTRYDRLWAVQESTERPTGWHRTGDVGHLDDLGRLWVEGRLVHVISTASGPLTPVGPEQRLETLPNVGRAAVVGVGPAGTQQVVAVLEPTNGKAGPLASSDLSRAARQVAGVGLAAVLIMERLPVDVRHQAKIDRLALARWAERVLAGRRPGRPR